ncbi:SDR family NAD(P)-dependent oxidoreductase [Methylomicrobium sp. Wu6]|uniref:NAD-dependent epimerase/dehydratase family protein n=1 Tax=Methylomicrobium sp. Wu6 TaxID=3107928 RepID=UPI002DD62E38|nr:SDR family NAD(P)-dependent oxidoreductase [Methylomicrobium sp. Wu6]MEC4750313.1 SDR family NAD(P)-dependent oxidoreductase [Methylomicrobium sp. Wu6]
MNVLITGGAGFIGSRLAKSLASSGAKVTVLDNLSEQIHGQGASFSDDLQSVAHCVQGDIRDRSLLARVIQGQEVIVHFAAETGTGQSMYAVEHYEEVNIRGTAVLLDILVNERSPTLRKLVVASSRAIYGEGRYRCAIHGDVYPKARSVSAMTKGYFEPFCPVCAGPVQVMPTTEDAPFSPSSFYGLTKQMQEQMVIMFAGALGIDGFALRYQNVYGPGQSLANPYTGILAVFSNLVRQGNSLNVFEDGQESRDFVYVDDVVQATALCIEPQVRGIHSLNVGSGKRTSVFDVAQAIVNYFDANVAVRVTGDFRLGDIRHNVADISSIRTLTGFTPKWSFNEGLHQFLAWAARNEANDAGYERSLAELKERGLFAVGAKH